MTESTSPDLSPSERLPKKSKWLKAKFGKLRGQLQTTEERARIAEENSLEDPTTKLKSRRWLDEQLEIAIAKAERQQQKIVKLQQQGKPIEDESDGSFWMVVEDVDDFKPLNAFFLWAGGDNFLQLMAKPKTRPGENKARYGGDEFAQLVNSDITEDAVITMVRRNAEIVRTESRILLSQLTPEISEYKGKPPPTETTLSIGLVRYQPGMTSTDLRTLTERAAAKAKETGDSIVISRDGQTLEPIPLSTSISAVTPN